MDHRNRALRELQQHASRVHGRTALVGLDGFVDTIVCPVATRHGQGELFDRVATIPEFAARIAGAAGKSTNIELYPVMRKLGGNGPIMAEALVAAGVSTRYIGTLGRPHVHEVFTSFAARTQAVSLAEPALTTAVEFTDGKIMLGQTTSLDAVTFEAVLDAMGEGAFIDALSRADLVALVNWTMIPNMTAVFMALLDRVLPSLPPNGARVWFFDLADPEKRTRSDLATALRTIARFQPHGTVTLGLNLKEAQQVATALDLNVPAPDEAGLRELARSIRQVLGIGTVVVHPRESAACATRDSTWWVPGPYVTNPKITTGAGDHFNAGFSAGQLMGLPPEACLTLGVCFSGFYVRTARSPSLNDIDGFLSAW